jgi:hypothetical protein
MELQEALQRAMKDPKVTSLKNYFLASVFSITEEGKGVKEWTFLFYDPEEKKIRDCIVNDKFTILNDEQQSQKDLMKMDANDVKVEINEALDIAQKTYSKKSISILITLHMKDRLVWTITFVGTDITATSYDIDAIDGTLLNEVSASLMKRL